VSGLVKPEAAELRQRSTVTPLRVEGAGEGQNLGHLLCRCRPRSQGRATHGPYAVPAEHESFPRDRCGGGCWARSFLSGPTIGTSRRSEPIFDSTNVRDFQHHHRSTVDDVPIEVDRTPIEL